MVERQDRALAVHRWRPTPERPWVGGTVHADRRHSDHGSDSLRGDDGSRGPQPPAAALQLIPLAAHRVLPPQLSGRAGPRGPGARVPARGACSAGAGARVSQPPPMPGQHGAAGQGAGRASRGHGARLFHEHARKRGPGDARPCGGAGLQKPPCPSPARSAGHGRRRVLRAEQVNSSQLLQPLLRAGGLQLATRDPDGCGWRGAGRDRHHAPGHAQRIGEKGGTRPQVAWPSR